MQSTQCYEPVRREHLNRTRSLPRFGHCVLLSSCDQDKRKQSDAQFEAIMSPQHLPRVRVIPGTSCSSTRAALAGYSGESLSQCSQQKLVSVSMPCLCAKRSPRTHIAPAQGRKESYTV